MNTKEKTVLLVMGTRHARMDNLFKELSERFGQINCAGILYPFNFKSKWIGNKDLDFSMVGDDPLDAIHIWFIDGDSKVLVSPYKDPPYGYDVIVGCRPRANRLENLPMHPTVFDLSCSSFYDLRDQKESAKVCRFWADYYRDKLGVRIALTAKLSLPVPKTVVICDIDTSAYETLKKKQ